MGQATMMVFPIPFCYLGRAHRDQDRKISQFLTDVKVNMTNDMTAGGAKEQRRVYSQTMVPYMQSTSVFSVSFAVEETIPLRIFAAEMS
jgi:hypothetical protein